MGPFLPLKQIKLELNKDIMTQIYNYIYNLIYPSTSLLTTNINLIDQKIIAKEYLS